MYLLVSTEEFLVTYCGEHFSEDLACEDGVFGVGYFADFFLFCFAGEAFCLCTTGLVQCAKTHTDAGSKLGTRQKEYPRTHALRTVRDGKRLMQTKRYNRKQ